MIQFPTFSSNQVMRSPIIHHDPNACCIKEGRQANFGQSTFPEFILEKEFQCHNTLLIKDVVCKTIQKFVKNPQDVRLSITVSFQPRTAAKIVSHEHLAYVFSEAIATIQVDKPGNFYPGGQEQRIRDRELEVFRKVEKDKERERKEMRRKNFENEDKTKQTMDLGVKRPPSTTTDGKARAAPPPPFKAEIRRLPTGEHYAVREWVGYGARKTPDASFPSMAFTRSPVVTEEEKPVLYDVRRPCSEEMHAVREAGERRDDDTDRDGSSMEAMDIMSEVEQEVEERKSTSYVELPSDTNVQSKGTVRKQGSVKLEDNGSSQKVIAYITVE